MKGSKNFFVGAAVGALVGLIIGLSISQVVGLLVGGLTSVIVAFFGLKNDERGTDGMLLSSKEIITSFCIFCIGFIVIGLYLRTHDCLSVSVDEYYDELRPLKLDSNRVKKIILLKKFGITEGQYTSAQPSSEADIPVATAKNPAQETTLYAADATNDERQTAINRYNTYSLNQLREYLDTQALPYKQFYASLDNMKIDTVFQKIIIINMISITYSYEK